VARVAVEPRGAVVQVDPIKRTLKPPGTKRLTQKNDELLSHCAFKFNSRRYNVVRLTLWDQTGWSTQTALDWNGLTNMPW